MPNGDWMCSASLAYVHERLQNERNEFEFVRTQSNSQPIWYIWPSTNWIQAKQCTYANAYLVTIFMNTNQNKCSNKNPKLSPVTAWREMHFDLAIKFRYTLLAQLKPKQSLIRNWLCAIACMHVDELKPHAAKEHHSNEIHWNWQIPLSGHYNANAAYITFLAPIICVTKCAS